MREKARIIRTAHAGDFPSFSEGLSLRAKNIGFRASSRRFPFLFGGTFIEGSMWLGLLAAAVIDFPSFSEGLSLRVSFLLSTYY